MLLSNEISDGFTKKRLEFTEKFFNKNLINKVCSTFSYNFPTTFQDTDLHLNSSSDKSQLKKRIFTDDCQIERKCVNKRLTDLKILRRQSYSIDDGTEKKLSSLMSNEVETLQVIKVYITDYEFKYFSIDENTYSGELVNAALIDFDLDEYKDQNDFGLCKVSVNNDYTIDQVDLSNNTNSLYEYLAPNIRFYIKNKKFNEKFLSDVVICKKMIKMNNLSILDLDPTIIAAQLCLRDLCLFKSIKTEEYRNYLLKKPAENLEKFVNMSNKEMFWVINEILNEPDFLKRSKIMKFFIQVAAICRECNNYNSLFAIVSGLTYSSIVRLDESWEKVPSKHKKTLKNLESILDLSYNMREYRNLLKNDQRRTPIIPMIAVCLKDLFFIFNHAKTNDFEKLDEFQEYVHIVKRMVYPSMNIKSLLNQPTSCSIIFKIFGFAKSSRIKISKEDNQSLYKESIRIKQVQNYLHRVFECQTNTSSILL